MEQRKREAQAREQHVEDFSTDDDDAWSVASIIPHELGLLDEVDEEVLPNMRIAAGTATRSPDHESQTTPD